MNMNATEFEKAYARISAGVTYTENQEGVGIYRLPLFSAMPLLAHGFSARGGGVSRGCFSSLNLSFSRACPNPTDGSAPELRESVLENYRIFSEACGFDANSMVADNYEHGTTVLPVTSKDCGRGFTAESLSPCDGLVTNEVGVTLITGHADCMAFYFYDPVTCSIGLCHAGWRGALHRIGENVVAQMQKNYGANPADIRAGLGPSLCPQCFEVGEDVAQMFENAFPGLALRGVYQGAHADGKATGKSTIDLWRVAAAQFLAAGIQPENVQFMQVCTRADHRLYSHRRDRGNTGGMAAYLAMQ